MYVVLPMFLVILLPTCVALFSNNNDNLEDPQPYVRRDRESSGVSEVRPKKNLIYPNYKDPIYDLPYFMISYKAPSQMMWTRSGQKYIGFSGGLSQQKLV